MSATSRPEIGSRGFAFRSWREYGNHGMTAVIRFAEASFAAWIISRSSIRLLVDRRGSRSGRGRRRRRGSTRRSGSRSRRSRTSPASTCPSSTPSCSAILLASSGCERPEKTISRFCGVSGERTAHAHLDRAGSRSRARASACSIVPVSTAAFLVDLAGARERERAGRHVFGDHRSRPRSTHRLRSSLGQRRHCRRRS